MTAACRYMYLCNARMWPPSCAVVCCGVLCRAVQCWEAKASGSHLLLRHFLQLLLSREIAAPKLLNPVSLNTTQWCLRRVSLPCAVATTSFLVLLLMGANGRTSVRDRLVVRWERARKGFAMAIFAGILPQNRLLKEKRRKEAHDTEGHR